MDLLYGRNSILEALRAGRRMRGVQVASGAHGLEAITAEARRRHIPVEVVQRRDLDRRVGEHHQGVLAEAEAFDYAHVDDLLAAAEGHAERPLLLILDSLQDPQNFGTLLRTAQACGAHGVVIPEHRAVGVTPAVSNASAGAVEHLQVARVTNLVRTIRDLKGRGVWVHGLVAEAGRPYWEADFTGPAAIVVGSEGSGLGRLVGEACDQHLQVPMAPVAIQSLNAAVAGSVVLCEAFRQRLKRR